MYKKCLKAEDILVCDEIPNILHKPGSSDCVSKVALERSIEEIWESCQWETDETSTTRELQIYWKMSL